MQHALMRRLAVVLVSCALIAGPSAVDAGNSKTNCEARKLNAAGKRHRCLARAAAKAHRSKPADPGACVVAFNGAIANANTKAAARGTSCRFLDHGDGTVSDLDTGLMWEMKVEGASCLHCVDDRYEWDEAMADWISEVNGRLGNFGILEPGLGGHRDWRLPTTEELGTITLESFRCSVQPCIDPVFGTTQESLYWSATSFVDSSTLGHLVSFSDGGRYAWDRTFPWFVRAVRAGF
jgi:hypothetical protein